MTTSVRTAAGPRGSIRVLSRRTGSLLLGAIVGYLVVVPTVTVVVAALRDTPFGMPGAFTLANVRQAVGTLAGAGVLGDTSAFAAGSTLVSVLVGGYLAWVAERTTDVVRTVIHSLVVVNLIVPGILTTISWTLLLHERIGLLNLLATRAGTPAPFDAYTLPAMIWVDGSDGFALPFLVIAAALRASDPAMEEAAVSAGASRWVALRTVTIPLLRPAILAATLIVLVRAAGSFVVPLVLGVPGGVRVLATEVYLQSRLFPSDGNLAAAFALVQLAFAFALLWGHQAATRGSGRFVTVGGRGTRGAGARTPRWRGLHAAAGSTLIGVVVLLPVGVMTYASLLPFYRAPGDGTALAWTLRNYAWLGESAQVRRAVLNTIVLGGAAAVLAVSLSLLVARRIVRRPGRGARVLDLLASLPLALPGTVLGVALLWWYLFLPLPVYGTRWVLLIALLTSFLPYGVRVVHSGLVQIGVELEEASAMSGARSWRTVMHIIAPLLAPVITAAVLFLLARSFTLLALPALLGAPGGDVVPTVILSLSTEARYSELSAFGVALSVALAGMTLLARLLARRLRGAA